jgi:hypothetical protein
MTKTFRRICIWLTVFLPSFLSVAADGQGSASRTEREVAIPVHLQDGNEFNIPLVQLIDYGRQLVTAKFTVQEGCGAPHEQGNRGSDLRP